MGTDRREARCKDGRRGASDVLDSGMSDRTVTDRASAGRRASQRGDSVSTALTARAAAVAATAVLACGVLGAAGCSNAPAADPAGQAPADSASQVSFAQVPSGPITVVAREDGSGTRTAFAQAFGLNAQDQTGAVYDATTLEAAVVNTTSAVMATVAQDPNAIGYISLGSLDATVKAVAIDGVLPSVDTVRDGSYPASRPLGLATEGELAPAARDFLDFALSAQGQAIVGENGYVPQYDGAAYEPAGLSGKVVVAGSSSVVPVMEKLAEAYCALNPDVRVEVHLSDSSTGVELAVDMVASMGMVSRELEPDEKAEGVEMTVVARDGVAVVVNTQSALENLTSAQVKDIFDGTDATWEDVLG